MVALARFFSPRQHGRLLCHWGIPFINTLSKARDPYINKFTLMRHLKSRDPDIKNAAAENASQRKPSCWNVEIFQAVLEGNLSTPAKHKALVAIRDHFATRAQSDVKPGESTVFFKMLAEQSPDIVKTFYHLWTQSGEKPPTVPEPFTEEIGGKNWPMKVTYQVGAWHIEETERLQPVDRHEEPVKLFENQWRHGAYSNHYQIGYMIDNYFFAF